MVMSGFIVLRLRGSGHLVEFYPKHSFLEDKLHDVAKETQLVMVKPTVVAT